MLGRFKKTEAVGAPEFLVAGLGNPEKKYTLTRHNSGFLCVDFLAEKHGFKINKLKFKAVIADTVINSHRCIVMKPQTYMNLSGEAVKAAADFYKIPPEKIIVIFDDISLDVGRLRKSLIPITTLPHGFSPSTKRTRHRSLKRHLIMPAVRWSLFWTAKQTKP